MLVRLEGHGPLHHRLYTELRSAVLEGRARPGERLPSSRALARALGVSRTVVVQAYERLMAEGWLEGRVGSGTFVTGGLSLPREAAGAEDASPAAGAPVPLSRWARRVLDPAPAATGRDTRLPLDFRYGRPDEASFPLRPWRRALARAGRRPPMAYGPPGGSERLREALAGYLARSRAVRAGPERILVVSGSQQALDLASRVLLDPGDGVVVEEPHYQGARQAFRAAGAHLHPVPVDGEGLVTDALPRGAGARLAYVTPSHQFPSGAVLSVKRRLALLAWAGREGAVVLEDDYDAEFRYDAPPVEAIQALDREGRVVYVGTVSKVLFPALRLGYVVLPPGLVAPFEAAKWVADRHSPGLAQEALATLMEEGTFERHLRRSRLRYGRRRAALLEALDTRLGGRVAVEGADAGVHVVAWLPGLEAARTPDLVREAAARGVGIYPVAPYYLEPPARAGLLLGYAALTEEAIREGVRRLAEALDAVEAAPVTSRGRR